MKLSKSLKTLATTSALAIVLTTFAAPAQACLWDYDTLAQEAEGIDDVISVVMGAFPRNSAKYYEIRLENAEKAIKANPQDWAAYDNAGVACDRLGKSDKAIAFMDAKVKAMKAAKYDASKEAQPNHSYRTKANLGTFHVHRWLKAGKDWSKMEDVEKAKKLIAAAIKENPDAHFGREIYQLKALEWLLSKPLDTKATFSKYGSPSTGYPDIMGLSKRPRVSSYKNKEKHAKEMATLEEMLHGLAGLMKMGNAWRSMDVLYSMKIIAVRQEKASLAAMIDYRMAELRRDDAKLMVPFALTAEDRKAGAKRKTRFSFESAFAPPEDHVIKANKRYFAEGRKAVQLWNEKRAKYADALLATGKHPDTDKDFWKGFESPMGFKVNVGTAPKGGAAAPSKNSHGGKRNSSPSNSPAEGKNSPADDRDSPRRSRRSKKLGEKQQKQKERLPARGSKDVQKNDDSPKKEAAPVKKGEGKWGSK